MAASQVHAAPECITAISQTQKHTHTPVKLNQVICLTFSCLLLQFVVNSSTRHTDDITSSFLSTAVNFWYDMEYDIKYNYFQLLESLCEVTGST